MARMLPLRRCLSESHVHVQRHKKRNRSKSLQLQPTYTIAPNNIDTVGTQRTLKDLLIYLIIALISFIKDETGLKKVKWRAQWKNYKKESQEESENREAQTIHDRRLINDCLNKLDRFGLEKCLENTQRYLANKHDLLKKSALLLYEDIFHYVNLVQTTNLKAFPLVDCSRNFEEYVQKESSAGQSINHNNSLPTDRIPHSMNMEIIRIGTYSNFPQSGSVSTIKLAKEGFYYTGDGDKVVCFTCGVHRSGWRATDDPREIHRQLSPNCSFLNSSQCTNIPIQDRDNITSSHSDTQTQEEYEARSSRQWNQGEEATILQSSTLSNSEIRQRENTRSPAPPCPSSTSSQQRDEYQIMSSERQEIEKPHERSRALQDKINVYLRNLDPLGINFDRPKYPAYAVVATRVSSFNDWPSSMTQTPRDLAVAGFLYVGYGDYTRCFFCGGGLRNWEPGDDPWKEHARWFPKCAFLRQNKGDEYVALVQIEHEEMEASEALESRESKQSNQSNSTSSETTSKTTTVANIFDLASVQSVSKWVTLDRL